MILSKSEGDKSLTNKEIARAANCSTRSVRRIRSNLLFFGSTKAPPNGGGRPKSISPLMLTALLEKLASEPSLRLEDMAALTHVLSTGQSLCWLTGWNFVTDIYGGLERSLRRSETAPDTFAQDPFQKHHELPGPLREAPDITSGGRLNRVGYQAVNIGRAFQLLRVELAVVQRAGAAKRCDIVKLAVFELGSAPISHNTRELSRCILTSSRGRVG